MQTCSQCSSQAEDSVIYCPNCHADLREFSTRAVALTRMKTNPRVQAIAIAVDDDACPACASLEGTYPKDGVPTLPVEGCSHENGCRCFYVPVLAVTFP